MKKYGITLFLTLILLLGLVVPAVSAQIPDAAPAETQEQSPELLDATVVAKGIDVSHHQGAINWDAVAGQIDFHHIVKLHALFLRLWRQSDRTG